MRKRWTLGALLAVTLTMAVPAAATAKPSSRVRNNDWVEGDLVRHGHLERGRERDNVVRRFGRCHGWGRR